MVPGREVIVGLVEKAVPQAAAYQHADEYVEEERLRLLHLEALLLVNLLHQEQAQAEAYHPAERVVAHGEGA